MSKKLQIESVKVLRESRPAAPFHQHAIRIIAGAYATIIPVVGTRAQALKEADEIRAEGWIEFEDPEYNAIARTARFELEREQETADRIASEVAWGYNRATEPRAAAVSIKEPNADVVERLDRIEAAIYAVNGEKAPHDNPERERTSTRTVRKI